MFAYAHEWNTSHLLYQSKVTEDIYVISEAFESFERKSLVRHSPNTARDFQKLRRQADETLNPGTDPSGEDIHIFLSRLWRMAFEATRDWLRIYDKLGLGQTYQKTMAVITLQALAPLKMYRSVLDSLPNLLFTLRVLEECSNRFQEYTGMSWMNWHPGQSAGIITALCETLSVHVVERWIHQHLTPLPSLSELVEDLPYFWDAFTGVQHKLYTQQKSWYEIFPDTEISIDVQHS